MLDQVVPKLAKVAPSCPKLAQSEPQVCPKLAPCWPMLVPMGPTLVPSGPQVGTCWSQLVQVSSSWPQGAPQTAPSWPMLAPVGPKLAPSWAIFHVAKRLTVATFSKAPPRPPRASTKALPLRLGFSKASTKALPQAFRRLIVPSGCSILLLSILKVVPFWRFF